MKKRWIVLLLAVLLLVPAAFGKMKQWRWLSHYREAGDFVTATGTVNHIADSEYGLFLGIEDATAVFSDTAFVLRGKNREIVLEKGILEMLQPGDQVTFTTHSWYPGDGYSMPIVAICVDGQWLLEFEEGHQNLLEYYRNE